jgi:hypothetical protein
MKRAIYNFVKSVDKVFAARNFPKSNDPIRRGDLLVRPGFAFQVVFILKILFPGKKVANFVR